MWQLKFRRWCCYYSVADDINVMMNSNRKMAIFPDFCSATMNHQYTIIVLFKCSCFITNRFFRFWHSLRSTNDWFACTLNFYTIAPVYKYFERYWLKSYSRLATFCVGNCSVWLVLIVRALMRTLPQFEQASEIIIWSLASHICLMLLTVIVVVVAAACMQCKKREKFTMLLKNSDHGLHKCASK